MARVTFHDWREENKRRKYPFSDNVPASNDTLTIPDDLFFDGRLYPIGGNAELYLSRVTIESNVITFAIRATGTEELATASFDLDDIPANGELVFFDTYGRAAGVLVSEQTLLQAFSGNDLGTYNFLLSQTQFAAAVVVAQPAPCVRGVILESGDVFTGEIWMVGEDGIVLRRDGDAIRIDIIGDPFASRKLCEDEADREVESQAVEPYCPIKTLNGITPDSKGNFQLISGENQALASILRFVAGSQGSSAVSRHLGGEGVLAFAALTIELIGELRTGEV